MAGYDKYFPRLDTYFFKGRSIPLCRLNELEENPPATIIVGKFVSKP